MMEPKPSQPEAKVCSERLADPDLQGDDGLARGNRGVGGGVGFGGVWG